LHYNESLLLALFLSFLTINDKIQHYSIRKIIESISKINKDLNKDLMINEFFKYENNRFLIEDSEGVIEKFFHSEEDEEKPMPDAIHS
jgi:hypothetical protein